MKEENKESRSRGVVKGKKEKEIVVKEEFLKEVQRKRKAGEALSTEEEERLKKEMCIALIVAYARFSKFVLKADALCRYMCFFHFIFG